VSVIVPDPQLLSTRPAYQVSEEKNQGDEAAAGPPGASGASRTPSVQRSRESIWLTTLAV
jgi:hypothetical protein